MIVCLSVCRCGCVLVCLSRVCVAPVLAVRRHDVTHPLLRLSGCRTRRSDVTRRLSGCRTRRYEVTRRLSGCRTRRSDVTRRLSGCRTRRSDVVRRFSGCRTRRYDVTQGSPAAERADMTSHKALRLPNAPIWRHTRLSGCRWWMPISHFYVVVSTLAQRETLASSRPECGEDDERNSRKPFYEFSR